MALVNDLSLCASTFNAKQRKPAVSSGAATAAMLAQITGFHLCFAAAEIFFPTAKKAHEQAV